MWATSRDGHSVGKEAINGLRVVDVLAGVACLLQALHCRLICMYCLFKFKSSSLFLVCLPVRPRAWAHKNLETSAWTSMATNTNESVTGADIIYTQQKSLTRTPASAAAVRLASNCRKVSSLTATLICFWESFLISCRIRCVFRFERDGTYENVSFMEQQGGKACKRKGEKQ